MPSGLDRRIQRVQEEGMYQKKYAVAYDGKGGDRDGTVLGEEVVEVLQEVMIKKKKVT